MASRSEPPAQGMTLAVYAAACPLVQLPNAGLCVSAPKLFPVAFNLVKSFMGEATQKKIVILGGKCLDPWSPGRAGSVLVWKSEAAAEGRLRLGHLLHSSGLASSAHFQFQVMA